MSDVLWPKLHGAAVHFPIALVLCSAACDTAGVLLRRRPCAPQVHAVAAWTIVFGALGSVGAVVSGLLMTKGIVFGHGMLRLHHLFVWPAFALVVTAATWRAAAGGRLAGWPFAAYLGAVWVSAGLMLVAAYWGGELLLRA